MTTSTQVRVPALSLEERALAHAAEHNEHHNLEQVLNYLRWSKLRGCALDAPYQPALSVKVIR